MKSFEEYINIKENVKKMNNYIDKNVELGKGLHEAIRAYYEHLLKLPSRFAEIFVPNFKDFEKLILKSGKLKKEIKKKAENREE